MYSNFWINNMWTYLKRFKIIKNENQAEKSQTLAWWAKVQEVHRYVASKNLLAKRALHNILTCMQPIPLHL